jgi:hypothetical protein
MKPSDDLERQLQLVGEAVRERPSLVARIMDQVRRIESNEGASHSETLVHAAERGSRAMSGRRRQEQRRVPRWLRWSAMIAMVVAMFICGTFFALLGNSGATSAFAEVQRAMRQVACVSYSVESIEKPEGLSGIDGTVVTEFAGRRFRFEKADGGSIHVSDFERGVFMDLLPSQKRAVIWHYNTGKHPTYAEFLERLRNGKADKVERLEDGEMDGRTVYRYRVPPESRMSGGAEILVSVDPITFLPVQIEVRTDALGFPLHILAKDFSYEPRDPSLFAMVPPEGYEVEILGESVGSGA